MRKIQINLDPRKFQAILCGDNYLSVNWLEDEYSQGDKVILHETKYSQEEVRNGAPSALTGRVMERVIRGRLPQGVMKLGWFELELGYV